jgi:hypothetical protein
MSPFIKLGREEGIDWEYVVAEDFRVILRKPYLSPVTPVSNAWFSLKDLGDGTVEIVIFKSYSFDGPTAVPDFDGTVEGSVVHDVIYQFVKLFMEAWKLPRITVLKFADHAFLEVMGQFRTNPIIARVYFAGVRVLGGPFNVAMEWLREYRIVRKRAQSA